LNSLNLTIIGKVKKKIEHPINPPPKNFFKKFDIVFKNDFDSFSFSFDFSNRILIPFVNF